MNATLEPHATPLPVLTVGRANLALAGIAAACLGIVFWSGLTLMVQWWIAREGYSYGWFIPPLAAFILWQRRDALRRLPFTGSWAGVVLVALALIVWLLGELSALYTLTQYAFLLALAGVVLSW